MSMKNTNRTHAVAETRERRGVTLVELIVAMTILTIGLLGIVGVSGSIARGLGEARSDNLAAIYAESRFEKLAGTACSSFTLGTPTTEATRGITEVYTITDAGNNTRSIVDVVTWKTRRGTRTSTFTTLLPCRPGA
jgi:prepilin-type N-terminal cleavage/methylation domain-containing protein